MIYDKYASPEDIAKAIGSSVATVYRYMKWKKNPLPHHKITDKKIVIKITDFEKWIESRVAQ